MPTFNPNKPVRTRDGREARIVSTDAKNEAGFNIVALVKNEFGDELVRSYQTDRFGAAAWYLGTGNGQSRFDLVNVPEEITEYRCATWDKGKDKPFLGTAGYDSLTECKRIHPTWEAYVRVVRNAQTGAIKSIATV